MNRFRKKYSLALLLFAAGTGLAFYMQSTLGEYTAFSALLIGIFGTQDVADKRLNGGTYSGEPDV